MLTHTIKNLENGMILLSIEVPSSSVNPLLQAFTAMTDLARNINQKAKEILSPTQLQDQRAAAERYHLSCKRDICDNFDKLWLDGNNVRDCISITYKTIKPLYTNVSYDIVKQILAHSGKLRKKNYNMEKKQLTQSG